MLEEGHNRLVEQIAKAMEAEHHRQLTEHLAQFSLDSSGYLEFFLSIVNESDRALAIVAFAYVDERLKELFARALNPEISGGTKSLLDGMAPLSASGPRIQMAAALFWLKPSTYKNLDLLRKIRNAFAHESAANELTNSKIRGLVSSMIPMEQPVLDAWRGETASPNNIGLRAQFFIRAAITCQCMIAELSAYPVAQRMGMSPKQVFSMGYEALPDEYKELARAAARVSLVMLEKAKADETAP